MKEYNAKIIVNDDELSIAFECDKEKNKNCKGNGNCRECNHTTDSRYAKAKARQHNKTITDKQIIINLEKEIEYYRHKIALLENDHKENVERINKQDKLIKEHQEILKEILIKKEDIFNIKTPNQIRELLGYKALSNKKTKELDKQFKITINKEEYLIRYNNDTDTVMLNAYITKLVNEKDKNAIYKDEEFKIINKTRCIKQEPKIDVNYSISTKYTY